MAAPGARMRVTVVVEALAEENAHGEHRDMALAAFKERRFAMPVQLDATFETVWSDIEQRYKTNYLGPHQAAAFSIKKLQDAYDCDLDMTDTVGAIFEGEPDRKMHLIKVIPHFMYRETSVVPGSMLRPAGAQKRPGDETDHAVSKRRRIELQQRPSTRDALDPSPNWPLPSTEARQEAAQGPAPLDTDDRSARSRSALSVVELGHIETGHAPFSSTAVKQESPEREQPSPLDDGLPEAAEAEGGTTEEAETAAPEQTACAQLESQEAAIHRSPLSSAERTPAFAANSRRDVYRVPSSPDFMHKKATPDKPAKTYARLEKKGPAASDADDNRDDNADLTASFLYQAAEPTPDNIQTPARKAVAKPVKPGSLKKPSRASLNATPASTKRSVKSNPTATPASTTTAKSSVKSKPNTPSNAGLSKVGKVLGEETMSRMERLEKLLHASQNTPRRQESASSRAGNGSIKSQDRSHRSSPEVRVPTANTPAPVKTNADAIGARSAVRSATAQATPKKSNVPLPPPKNQKSLYARAATPKGAVEAANSGEAKKFKKPAAKARESLATSTVANKTSAIASTGTPKRSEVPLPPNVRHLRRSSSLQTSPLQNGNINTNNISPSVPVETPATLTRITPKLSTVSIKNTVAGSTEPTSTPQPVNGAVVISSAEPSSTSYSDSDDEGQRESPKGDMEETVSNTGALAELQNLVQVHPMTKPYNDDFAPAEKAPDQSDNSIEQIESNDTIVASSQAQGEPPSGQGSSQAVPWNTDSWGFDRLSRTKTACDKPEEGHGRQATTTTAAPISEDEGFAEQDIYSTAIEDNASRSRSSSANASTRSSPAISRQPARFLSHSPTPDASESEGDLDDASPSPSRDASPRDNDRDESGSESESSSESSEDDVVEMPDLRTKSANEPSFKFAPASSPPLTGPTNLTPIVPDTSQSTPSGTSRPVHQTPVPLPTQQSSQVPRSSQSVSVQAADRRRYTGFRSLREQLADTKAAQATTQKKTFDPRTMSLGKLAKDKPLVGLGGDDDESSDDESSSSSSDDSD